MAGVLEGLAGEMIAAGRTAAADIWDQIRTFAIPELKKIAVQIEALADPDSPWSRAEKKLLFKMQRDAAVSVSTLLPHPGGANLDTAASARDGRRPEPPA